MGQRAKWLQDERYIRIAGALLMVSPFLNYFFSVAFNTNVPDKWAFKQLLAGFMIASGFSWLGRISNFIVGFLMFRGKSSAWVPVLAILGFTIAKNAITFSGDYQINKLQTVGGLIINVLLFFLVFESEYRINKEINKRIREAQLQRAQKNTIKKDSSQFKQNVEKQESPLDSKPTVKTVNSEKIVKKNARIFKAKINVEKQLKAKSAPIQKKQKVFFVKKGAAIDFDGFGKFAEVFHCTENELWLKVTEHLPGDIHKKTLTLQAPGEHWKIKLKFSRIQDDSTLVFRVVA